VLKNVFTHWRTFSIFPLISIVTAAVCFVLDGQFAQQVNDQDSQLQQLGCEAESSLQSSPGGASTNIQFENQSSRTIKVYWIDFTGKRQHYFDLAANQKYLQQTYVNHPWVITEHGENQPCLRIVLPDAKPGVLIFR
jgi:hypothetical protein